MYVGSLFSGAGLCDYGFSLAGFEHAFFCECSAFCRNILARRWPGVPIYNDVATLRVEDLPKVDVLVGGFPCQDISCAGLRSKGLDVVLGDLSGFGYDAEWQTISAASLGAPHLRERLFVVAYPHSDGDMQEPRLLFEEGPDLSELHERRLLCA